MFPRKIIVLPGDVDLTVIVTPVSRVRLVQGSAQLLPALNRRRSRYRGRYGSCGFRLWTNYAVPNIAGGYPNAASRRVRQCRSRNHDDSDLIDWLVTRIPPDAGERAPAFVPHAPRPASRRSRGQVAPTSVTPAATLRPV